MKPGVKYSRPPGLRKASSPLRRGGAGEPQVLGMGVDQDFREISAVKFAGAGRGAFGVAEGSVFQKGRCHSLRSVRRLGMDARGSVIKTSRSCSESVGVHVHNACRLYLLGPHAPEFTRKCNTTSRVECPSAHRRYTRLRCRPSGSGSRTTRAFVNWKFSRRTDHARSCREGSQPGKPCRARDSESQKRSLHRMPRN